LVLGKNPGTPNIERDWAKKVLKRGAWGGGTGKQKKNRRSQGKIKPPKRQGGGEKPSNDYDEKVWIPEKGEPVHTSAKMRRRNSDAIGGSS